jgi:steroid 5-alpha reductase family enzyme
MTESLFYLLFVLLNGAKVVLAIGIIGFLISLWKKDNGVADVIYAWHFISLAALAAFLSYMLGTIFGMFPSISIFLAFLVFIWGVRLSFRIYLKNKGKPEDFRYAAWRSAWKWPKTRSFFQIYLLQGIIALIIASPAVLTIIFTPTKLDVTIALGVVIWLTGFIFELLGDAQLDRFIKDSANRGKIMTTGLWKYSRHPNYFGESLMWWGLWVASLGGAGDIWYITILSPLLITFLLLKVSGVPLLEARMKENPEWAAYAAKTSMFIPWLPGAGRIKHENKG